MAIYSHLAETVRCTLAFNIKYKYVILTTFKPPQTYMALIQAMSVFCSDIPCGIWFFVFFFRLLLFLHFTRSMCAHSQIPKRKTQGKNAILLVDEIHKTEISHSLTIRFAQPNQNTSNEKQKPQTIETMKGKKESRESTINPRFLSQLLH